MYCRRRRYTSVSNLGFLIFPPSSVPVITRKFDGAHPIIIFTIKKGNFLPMLQRQNITFRYALSYLHPKRAGTLDKPHHSILSASAHGSASCQSPDPGTRQLSAQTFRYSLKSASSLDLKRCKPFGAFTFIRMSSQNHQSGFPDGSPSISTSTSTVNTCAKSTPSGELIS